MIPFNHLDSETWPHILDGDREAYLHIIDDAVTIHIDREKIRRGLWKEYPARDQLNQVKVKIDRILRTLELIEQTEDPDEKQTLIDAVVSEGYDIINYTVFGIRILEGTVS